MWIKDILLYILLGIIGVILSTLLIASGVVVAGAVLAYVFWDISIFEKALTLVYNALILRAGALVFFILFIKEIWNATKQNMGKLI